MRFAVLLVMAGCYGGAGPVVSLNTTGAVGYGFDTTAFMLTPLDASIIPVGVAGGARYSSGTTTAYGALRAFAPLDGGIGTVRSYLTPYASAEVGLASVISGPASTGFMGGVGISDITGLTLGCTGPNLGASIELGVRWIAGALELYLAPKIMATPPRECIDI
jgi:hypothetical protein